MIKRVIICGDRHWTDRKKITAAVLKLNKKFGKTGWILIEGEAKGADTIAAQVASNHGVHVARVEAYWDEYHQAAGPIRNKMMLALNPHIVIGFHEDLEHSTGTKDMLTRAKKAGKKVIHLS